MRKRTPTSALCSVMSFLRNNLQVSLDNVLPIIASITNAGKLSHCIDCWENWMDEELRTMKIEDATYAAFVVHQNRWAIRDDVHQIVEAYIANQG